MNKTFLKHTFKLKKKNHQKLKYGLTKYKNKY